MAQMPAYRSRYGDTITDLLARRGDIAAQGHLQSGAIWGNAVGNIGQIAGQAVQGYAQMQEQKREQEAQSKRDEALTQFIDSGIWAEDPKAALTGSIKILGPKDGPRFAEGLIGVAKLSQAPTPEDAAKNLSAVARGLLAAPDTMKPGLYKQARDLVIKKGIGTADDFPEAFSAELVPVIAAIAGQQQAPVKPVQEVVETIGPDGKPIKRLATEAELRAGVPVYQKPEKEPVDVEGRMIRAEERREARAIEAEQRKAEATAAKAAETAKAAAKETNTQVDSAFAAMDAALKEVERLSGTKALTSPLESANARQQYQAAASAFAATLSRATGDSRISDLDRKAYAGLLAYAGPGSTLLNITRPDLARKRFTEAKKFFTEAAKARAGEPTASTPAGGSDDDPLGIRK